MLYSPSVPPEPAPRKNRPQTSSSTIVAAATANRDDSNSFDTFTPQRRTGNRAAAKDDDECIDINNSFSVSNSAYSFSSRRQFQQNPYFKSHQLAFTPSPPPPHQSMKDKEDPRPFVLGLPKQTEISVRRSAYVENLAELSRRSQQATMIGTEMDERNEIICQWAAGADWLVQFCFSSEVQSEDCNPSHHRMNNDHFLCVAVELYSRQIQAFRAEVELEEAREQRTLVFEHSRDIFVHSRQVRAKLRNFIAAWVAIRRAKIVKARLYREDMCRREEKVRLDLMKSESAQASDLMLSITTELCYVSKLRMAAFVLSMQRGLWMSTLRFAEQEELRDLLWGIRAPMPPRELVDRLFAADANAANPGLTLSLQCAELAHRDILHSHERASATLLQHDCERSQLESLCVFGKREMLVEFHDNFMDKEFLPRSAAILHWHARRDVENAEFETRLEFEQTLLRECDDEIKHSILEMRRRAQAKIAATWRMHLGKRPYRERRLAVFKEVLRQEREYETELQRQEMEEKFSLHARMDSLVDVIEPQYRFCLEEPSWQESFMYSLVLAEAVSMRKVWLNETWKEFSWIGEALIARGRQFNHDSDLVLIDGEQWALDIVAAEEEQRRDLTERFALHCRIKGQLDSIEEDAMPKIVSKKETTTTTTTLMPPSAPESESVPLTIETKNEEEQKPVTKSPVKIVPICSPEAAARREALNTLFARENLDVVPRTQYELFPAAIEDNSFHCVVSSTSTWKNQLLATDCKNRSEKLSSFIFQVTSDFYVRIQPSKMKTKGLKFNGLGNPVTCEEVVEDNDNEFKFEVVVLENGSFSLGVPEFTSTSSRPSIMLQGQKLDQEIYIFSAVRAEDATNFTELKLEPVEL